MASLLPGYGYDILVCSRRNDNKSGWITEFEKDLGGISELNPANAQFHLWYRHGFGRVGGRDFIKGKSTCALAFQ
jgi:hypothetical protein